MPSQLEPRTSVPSPELIVFGALPNGEGSAGLEARQSHLSPLIGRLGLYDPEEAVREQDIVRSWETEGVVKAAPRLEEQLQDTSRLTPFDYTEDKASYKTFSRLPEGFIKGTEIELHGLLEVHDLLTAYLATDFAQSKKYSLEHEQALKAKSKDILDNLTFIGEKEYAEAAAGIGVAWKAFLDEDPERKLCVLTEANKLDRYSGTRKSDDYLMNRILGTFSDEELIRYRGRIVNGLEDMGEHPAESSRVVLLDDWTISGQSMRGIHDELSKDPRYRKYFEADAVEINLIVASRDRIENGLHIVPGQPEEGTIPVKSYFLAHHAPTAHSSHHSYVTGTHSPVNYGFSEVCRKVGRRMQLGLKSEGAVRPPRLVSIVPEYRDEVPTIKISADELRPYTPAERTRLRAIKQAGVLSIAGAEG